MAETLNLSRFLPYLLSITSNAVSDRIAREYQTRFGLKIPEWRVLAMLGQGKPMTQRELVTATVMDKVTVSRATAALVERRLVERSPSRHDGRSHHLALTQEGVSLYEMIAPAALAMEQQILAGLNEQERGQLTSILAKLRNAVSALK